MGLVADLEEIGLKPVKEVETNAGIDKQNNVQQ